MAVEVECQVFIQYWSWTDNRWPDYFLDKLLKNIKAVTDDRVGYEVVIFEDHSHPECAKGIDEKFGGSGAKIVHYHEGENLGQRGRNKINSLVEAPYYVILQPDVLVTRGWLYNLVTETKLAEEKYGKPSLVSPLFIPYPLYLYEAGTFEAHKRGDVFASQAEVEAFCRKHGIPYWEGQVFSMGPSIANVTDNGHRLMMYCASKRFAKSTASHWDTRYKSGGYEDNDAGIQAILKGGKNLVSNTTYLHHLIGHSRSPHAQTNQPGNNKQVFIEKWGQEMWDEMETGQLWLRLHRENP